jgi:hypothetical protein
MSAPRHRHRHGPARNRRANAAPPRQAPAFTGELGESCLSDENGAAGATLAEKAGMGHSHALQSFPDYGSERNIPMQRQPRPQFEYGATARVVTFEELRRPVQLGWLDRIIRAINSALLQ